MSTRQKKELFNIKDKHTSQDKIKNFYNYLSNILLLIFSFPKPSFMKFEVRHLLSKCMLLLLMVGASTFAFAQAVSGTVTDAGTGEALIGANILVKGTDVGATTNIEGKYSITVPDGGTTLVFSYTGYAGQEVAINGQSTVDVQMREGVDVGELVVVGYGSIRKGDATDAITSISEKDFNRGVIASPEQLIQGRAAGVQITSASGEPGGGINIRIRGTSSVRAGNNPLFVVDGVPLSGDNTNAGGGDVGGYGGSSAKNPLNFLNPNDIASIDILKDASATAIYGSRGANGVVIITTKSGQAGAGKLEYSYNLGISSISKRYDLLNRDQFLSAYADINGQDAANNIDAGGNTDWQDEIFRTAFTHAHNLSFGSGDANGNYRFSLGYQDQDGIVTNTGMKRMTARFNANRKFLDERLNIGVQATVANTNDRNALITDNAGFRGDLLGNIIKSRPTNPVYNTDGTYFQQSGDELNPVAVNDLTRSISQNLRALGNVTGSFNLTDDLTFNTILGFDRSSSNRVDAFSSDLLAAGIDGRGRLFSNDLAVNNTLWENYLTYDSKVSEDLSVNAVVGYSYQRFDYSGKNFQATNFRTSDLNVMINNIASADQGSSTSLVGNSFKEIDELQSYFGRVNFNFQDKYLLKVSLRADGSTRFGSGNKYGYFPAASFRWNIMQEGFAPEAFSNLALRLGYGVTGNQAIPHNRFTDRSRYGNFGLDDGGNVTGGGLGTVAFANPNLKWESTSQVNAGLDYGFSNGRIYGTLDYYYKNTNDLLFLVTAAQPAAQPFVWENLDADVINSGVELSLSIVAQDGEDFSWTITTNAAYNNNVVRNFTGNVNTGVISGQGLSGAFAQRIAGDQPLFAYYVRDFQGYDSEGITIYGTGDFQQFLGQSPLPKWNVGLTNDFSFGDFDLSIFFNSLAGHYVYNNTANAFFTAGALGAGRNVNTAVTNSAESNLNAPDVSSRFLENASFLRLQNITLGYNADASSLNGVSNVRLFVTGQNLFVLTGYSGQDPEVNVNKALNGIPSFGIDYTPYPRARTFTLGVNVTF